MSLTLDQLKVTGTEGSTIYVLRNPSDVESSSGFHEAMAIPILKRRTGVMLALPIDFLPPEPLALGMLAQEDDLLGPSVIASVPLVTEEVDGSEVPNGLEVDLLMMDFGLEVLPLLRDFDPVTDVGKILYFSSESIDFLPSSQTLQIRGSEWIQGAHEERMVFYSATEEQPALAAKSSAPTPKKAAAKRVSTASLAEQLAQLSQIIPAMSSQLESLQAEQKRMGGMLSGSVAMTPTEHHPARPPAIRQPFATPSPGADLKAKFLADLGPPPRSRAAPALPLGPSSQRATGIPGEEPFLAPFEEGYMDQLRENRPPQVADILAQQSQALTSLVAHLANQDGFGDLGGASSSSSGISLKGSAKREKLLQDLASRKRDFLLKVAQNAYRRLRPSERTPASLDEFQNIPVFAKYLERHGGFSGNREIGLTMWLLAQVADQMLQGDQKGAQELLALAMVTLEQVAQDGGKWEVGWLLSLQEDPPPGVFQHRPAATNPRLRAFGALCPPDWAATALSYVKEPDIISTRRQEALPPKKPQPKAGEENPNPKKAPKFPKKPKKGDDKSEGA